MGSTLCRSEQGGRSASRPRVCEFKCPLTVTLARAAEEGLISRVEPAAFCKVRGPTNGEGAVIASAVLKGEERVMVETRNNSAGRGELLPGFETRRLSNLPPQ